MPPTAAIVPAMPKTMMRVRVTWMPARRAASALPPTANTWRPKRVREATYCMPTTNAIRIRTASGMPRSAFSTATTAITVAARMMMRAVGPAASVSASPALRRACRLESVIAA